MGNAKIDFSDVILKLEDINKSFPGVKALQHMQIELARGEMHAVCGENGAGKSTMMKVIPGVHKADSGKIYLNGEQVTIREPNDAYGKGIAIIFQETSLFKDLTVLENMFMGHEPVTKLAGFISNIDYGAMRKKADEIFDFLGIAGQIDYDAKIDNLGVASKQMVEIAKALTYDAKVLIFDEPTAALTNKEVRALFRTIARLKEQGMSMLYISHRMEEIFEIADRVTVIRDGSYVNTAPIEDVTEQQLISWMVGREMSDMYPKAEVEIGDTILKVSNLCRSGEKDGFPLDHVSFEVRKGEIFGIAGLAGAGRTEMAECLCGLRKYESGEVTLEGRQLHVKNYREAIDSCGMSDTCIFNGIATPGDSKAYLESGLMTTVVLWQAYDLGYLAVDAAYAAATGELKEGATSYVSGLSGQTQVEGVSTYDDSHHVDGVTVYLGTPATFNLDTLDCWKS